LKLAGRNGIEHTYDLALENASWNGVEGNLSLVAGSYAWQRILPYR
jgi:hypothetical protein